MDTCKICGGKIKKMCKCSRRDSWCENGHVFHWSPYHQAFHVGESDHGTDSFGSNCCENKEKC